MVKRYITQGNLLMEVNRADGGCWVNLVAPTLEECVQIAQEFQIDLADVRAALDDEESSRVDVSNEYSLILFDVPSVEYRHQREAYTTIPLGLILVNDVLLTVCAEATPVLKNFLENTVKEFSTKKQMRFIYQIFFAFLHAVSVLSAHYRSQAEGDRGAYWGRYGGNGADRLT